MKNNNISIEKNQKTKIFQNDNEMEEETLCFSQKKNKKKQKYIKK